MNRLRLDPQIIPSMLIAILWLAFNLAFIRVALLHPEQINAKDDAGMWVTRTPAQIKINGYFSLGIGVAMSCVGVCMIAHVLKGYIFQVRDEKFFCTLD